MPRKEKKYHYIYKITNLKNNKYYIGMHSTSNLDDEYFGSGKRLRNSIRKHGKEVHLKEILEYLPDRESLAAREEEIVNEELLKDPLCMNLKLGGEGWCCSGIQIGGDKFNYVNKHYWNIPENKERQRNNLSKISKELWSDENYRKKMLEVLSKSFLGKNHSENTKEKMRGHERQSGEKNSQFGTCWINNDDLKKSIRIKKIELENYINNGWILGMKMNHFKNMNSE